jgi:hypothetical protein
MPSIGPMNEAKARGPAQGIDISSTSQTDPCRIHGSEADLPPIDSAASQTFLRCRSRERRPDGMMDVSKPIMKYPPTPATSWRGL